MGDPTEDKPKRRWWHRLYRLHVTTWVLLMILIACMVRINFVGLHQHPEDFFSLRFRYGWPCVFLSLSPEQLRSIGFVSILQSIDLIQLTINVFIGALLCVSQIAVSEYWISRRKNIGRLQIKLSEILLLTFLISLWLGWWKSNALLHTTEEDISSEHRIAIESDHSRHSISYSSGVYAQDEYVAPIWLLKLIGYHRLQYDFCHIHSLEFSSMQSLKRVGKEDVGKLRYLRTICLSTWKRNQVTGIKGFMDLEDDALIEGIGIWGKPEVLAKDELLYLKQLGHIEKLSLSCELTLVEDLVSLDDARFLRKLHLDIMATKQELEAYKKSRPNLEVTWGETYPQEVVQKIRNVRAILDEMNSSNL